MAKYEDWTRTQLIARLSQLDDDTGVARPRRKLGFDISSKPRRKIALKFCYHGWEYSGLELQKGHSVFPTVESVLEAALIGARLIDPAGGLEGAELSKSGRTDRGVSAAGQVISLWVRSMAAEREMDERIPRGMEELDLERDDEVDASEEGGLGELPGTVASTSQSSTQPPPASLVDEATQHLLSTESEIPYAATLNRLLPPSIRILSWSPVTSDFKARFACIGRHYKYFFRLHSGLDLGRMRDAAQRLEGTHDWRNFCKLDGSKGDVNYLRTVDLATIDRALDDTTGFAPGQGPGERITDPALYVINVRGLGFLYHQIRHIAAVLFLVGQGLEEPSIVTSLLNTDPANPIPPFRADEPPPAVLENKPVYEIADPLPLVLWDTLYRDEDVRWQPAARFWENGFLTEFNKLYTASLMQTTLLSYFMRAAELAPGRPTVESGTQGRGPTRIELGGGQTRVNKVYRPILKRERGNTPDEVVRRHREGKARKLAAANGDGVDELDEAEDVDE